MNPARHAREEMLSNSRKHQMQFKRILAKEISASEDIALLWLGYFLFLFLLGIF